MVEDILDEIEGERRGKDVSQDYMANSFHLLILSHVLTQKFKQRF